MNKYIESLEFRLKDSNKTKDKYQDYKAEEFKNLIKENYRIIDSHLRELKGKITDNFYRGNMSPFYFNLDLNSKSDVKILKNNVNFVTYDINKELIISLLNRPNQNKVKSFTVKFYLKYYDRINSIMKEAFLDLCEREGI